MEINYSGYYGFLLVGGFIGAYSKVGVTGFSTDLVGHGDQVVVLVVAVVYAVA